MEFLDELENKVDRLIEMVYNQKEEISQCKNDLDRKQIE